MDRLIIVELSCDNPGCKGPETDAVDVYADHLRDEAVVGNFIPPEWTVRPGTDARGYPIVWCPTCSEGDD